MRLYDKTGAVGNPKILLVYQDGSSSLHYADKNVITNQIKQDYIDSIIAPLMSDPINEIQIGTGGTIDPAGKYPKSVTSKISALYSPLMNLTQMTYTKATDGLSVTYLANLDNTQGNNQLISEVGLITQSGALFAYKAFPGIPKTDSFSIHFLWTIEYV